MNFAGRRELRNCAANIATWADRYQPPAAERNPRNVSYWKALAEANMAEHNYGEAAKAWRELVALGPDALPTILTAFDGAGIRGLRLLGILSDDGTGRANGE